jgi:hypothetical protein
VAAGDHATEIRPGNIAQEKRLALVVSLPAKEWQRGCDSGDLPGRWAAVEKPTSSLKACCRIK